MKISEKCQKCGKKKSELRFVHMSDEWHCNSCIKERQDELNKIVEYAVDNSEENLQLRKEAAKLINEFLRKKPSSASFHLKEDEGQHDSDM